MGNILNKSLYLGFWILTLSSCEKFELRGFLFSYENVDERFTQSIAWNNSNPYKVITIDTNYYTIYVMADSHIGSINNFNYFIAHAINNKAIASVMAGDLTTGHATDYKTFNDALPGWAVLPTFPIAGNHDIYFEGWTQFHSLFGSSTYLFYVKTPNGTDIYICLDTAGGTLGDLQYKWLRDVLSTERLDCRRCVIFTHNNILQFRKIATTTPNLEELYSLKELFIKHQVDAVITGHDHKKDQIEFGKTKYISLDALLDGHKEAGFLVLSVTDGNLGFDHLNISEPG
jgi:3',5'-cyclic AMP phosphodiesterase CpdA